MKWHENIQNDPYQNNKPDNLGCGESLLVLGGWLVLVIFLVCCVGCKSQAVPVQKDSVRIEVRHDSVYVYKHDSIFRDRWRSGDTTYIVTEKWRTLYKDKLVEVHDTIRTNEVQVQEVKYVPAYYKNTSTGFWILFVILLVIVGWRVGRFIIKIKTGGLL